MAQAFLETDFLLRRATPAPARASAQATSRPAFVVRDPEPSRAAAPTRSQDPRAQEARSQESRSQESRSQEPRSQTSRSERDRPEVAAQPERGKTERGKTDGAGTGQTETGEKVEGSPAPARTARDASVPTARATASATADPAGETARANGVPQEKAGAVSPTPAGVAGSPEAAMAATVLAGGNPATKAGSADGTTLDGTEEKTESTEAPAKEPDASFLALAVPPPPPPTDPVREAGAGQGGQTSAPQTGVQADRQQALSVTGQGPAPAGQIQSPAGVIQPSKGDVPVLAGEDSLARRGGADGGKSDPAVSVREPGKAAETALATAALGLPEGLSPLRESFDSGLANVSAAPTTTPAAGTSATTAQAPQTAVPASPPVPLGAVPMTIGLRSLQGSNHFEIRLDPGDLGRIDVSLDIDKERGTVMAHLVVDRIETLALLQRDAGSLQQALSQAGLDAPEANINLSLRSDTQSGGRGTDGQDSDGHRPDGRPGGPSLPHQPESRAALEAIPLRTLRGLTGLDIRI